LVNGNGLIIGQNIPLYGGQTIELLFLTAYSNWIRVNLIPESVALTGVSTVPTASPGTSTTQIANTAFVEGAVNPSWSNFTFQNSFTNFGTPFGNCQFTKIKGIVYLKGVATRATSGMSSGIIIATLPTGFRPSEVIFFPQDSRFNTTARIIIDSSGNISYDYSTLPTTIVPTFTGINFIPA
jgi:hypothetical protein